ncbi:GAF domain-containing SpoIIE family protein phosphatase [Streptomyces sp. NPDC048417]|uniref:PP2C family protein-serine/threonine phosphatase n=1 Tax=Streptomyces sp. NPDC048417 TaxID=3155387 RepID=UPI0034417849
MTRLPEDGPLRGFETVPPVPQLTYEHLDRIEKGLRQAARTPGRAEELLDAVLEVSKELELDAVLQRIIDTARELVRARYAALGVLGGTGRFTKVIRSGFEDNAPDAGSGSPHGAALLSRLLRAPRPLPVENHAGQRHTGSGPEEPLPTATLVGLPIRVRDKLYGHLYLAEKTTGESFDADDRSLLTALAGAAGVAIENARLYQQVRQATEQFQRRLLPEMPSIEGLELQARYLPSSEAPRIGGDWYDLIRLPDRVPCLMLGDVMGHGIAAATVMSQISNMLRVIAFDEQEPPSSILRRLDTVLHELHGGPMATVIIARLEPDGNAWRLRWASAGHLPPLVSTPDHQARYLTAETGLPLGVDPNMPRPDHEDVLEPGSTLLLHTDGLVEHRTWHIDDGMNQAVAVAALLATEPLAELCDGLLSRREVAFHDDVALLAVRMC